MVCETILFSCSKALPVMQWCNSVSRNKLEHEIRAGGFSMLVYVLVSLIEHFSTVPTKRCSRILRQELSGMSSSNTSSLVNDTNVELVVQSAEVVVAKMTTFQA